MRRYRRQVAVFTLLLASSHRPHAALSTSVTAFSSDPSQRPAAATSTGIRLNKVFRSTHSRRQADALLESGRVAVNGQPVVQKGGFLVVPFVDTVTLDGKVVEGWEEMNGILVLLPNETDDDADRILSRDDGGNTDSTKTDRSHPNSKTRRKRTKQPQQIIATKQFHYVKYWKPRGVTCTTDRSDRSNIIDAILHDGYRPKHRIYPVGRLDKDTAGLILLTSDGRLPNSALRMKNKQPKVYEAVVDRTIRNADLQRLRDGVVITTDVARNGKHKAVTQRTLPCRIERVDDYCMRLTLVEGRNRQVRKMTAALDYFTTDLMRIEFMGIGLEPLEGPGDWAELSDEEMDIVRNVLASAADERQS